LTTNPALHPSPPARPLPFLQIVGILLLFAVVYVGSLFAPGLQDDADSSHAEAAREMSVTRDFVTLKINGNRYLEKAPLMYWAVTICYWCFGVNEFAAHLPIALSILLLILLAIRWGRRAFGERSAIYAGLFLATAAGCYLFTRILIPESILSFFYCRCVLFFGDRFGRWPRMALVCWLFVHCSGCADQGIALAGGCGRRCDFVSCHQRRVAALAGISACYRYSSLLSGCRALAHPGGHSQSAFFFGFIL